MGGLFNISGVMSAIDKLVELGISEILANDLRKFLVDSAADLTTSEPDAVGHGAYGGSPGSIQLASDASKARLHVAEALKDMASGLTGYGDIVHQLFTDVSNTDDKAEQEFVAQTKKADALIPVSFAAAHPGHHDGHGGNGGGN